MGFVLYYAGNGESLKKHHRWGNCEGTVKSEVIENKGKELVIWHQAATGSNPDSDSYKLWKKFCNLSSVLFTCKMYLSGRSDGQMKLCLLHSLAQRLKTQ